VLAGEYISDLTDVRGAIALLKSAKTSAEVAKAKADLQTVKEQLHHGEGLASRIEAALNDDSNSPESQLKAINDLRDHLASLGRDGEFAEARDALKKLEAAEAPAQREKTALLRKLDWLVDFKETLAADVAAHGCTVPLQKTDGSEIKGEVKSISGPGIELKSGSPVEWSKVSPESLLGLAKALASTGPNPAEVAHRAWLAGIYGLLSGKKEAVRPLLEGAAKFRPDYADALPILLPTQPVNLARGANATASGYVANKDHIETPDRAIDGSTASKWCIDQQSPQWLRLDLHKETKINRWVVKHAQSGGESADFNTVDFALEKSSDDKTWTKVDAVTGNKAEVTNRDVKPFQARYIRLNVTKPTRNGNHSARICEFELYGPASSEIPDLFAALQSSPVPHLEATNIGLDPGPAAGSSEADDSTGMLTIQAAGNDIWFGKDAGRFLSRKLTGNGELIARVESIGHTNPWSKSGLMFRASLTPEARNVYLCASAENGTSLQVRKEDGKDSDSFHDGSHPTPVWLKLVRKGDVFTGFASPDGVAWSQVGDPQTVAMGGEVYAGIAATSHEEGKQSVSKLDEIQINAE
jgi:F5/8 type C domain